MHLCIYWGMACVTECIWNSQHILQESLLFCHAASGNKLVLLGWTASAFTHWTILPVPKEITIQLVLQISFLQYCKFTCAQQALYHWTQGPRIFTLKVHTDLLPVNCWSTLSCNSFFLPWWRFIDKICSFITWFVFQLLLRLINHNSTDKQLPCTADSSFFSKLGNSRTVESFLMCFIVFGQSTFASSVLYVQL